MREFLKNNIGKITIGMMAGAVVGITVWLWNVIMGKES